MALNWDITKCDESVKSDENWPLTEYLIWGTIGVGINTITEDNAKLFFERLNLFDRVLTPAGPIMTTDDDGELTYRHVTLDEVKARIGLKTNASPLTKAKFLSNVWESHERWNNN